MNLILINSDEMLITQLFLTLLIANVHTHTKLACQTILLDQPEVNHVEDVTCSGRGLIWKNARDTRQEEI